MVILKTKKEREYYRKFHIPGCSNLMSVKLNAIFINRNEKGGYTLLHERTKFELAWEAKGNGDNFIIEAARRATDEEREIFKVRKDKVVDFINLSQQQEYEIVHLHEDHKMVKHYKENGIIAILVGDKFQCKKCLISYPALTKYHRIEQICDNCKGEKDETS